MENTTENYEAFLQELVKLSEICCDAMSEMRLELYWQAVAPHVTMEEWRHACAQAIKKERFHRVPMPGVLMDYATALRRKVVI